MGNSLKVVEIFDSIQGEGVDTGKLVTFVRLSGCNLSCSFCDTDHKKGTAMDIKDIYDKCLPSVVITGGEPLRQNILPLARMLWQKSRIAIETNGTIEIPDTLDPLLSTISMSPKVPRPKCKLHRCSSLKVLFPYYKDITAESYNSFPAPFKSLQVIDPIIDGAPNYTVIEEAINEVKRLNSIGMTWWRLGIQLHKVIGIA